MDRYSISFTLGKASDPHGANIAHNNRNFTAANVNGTQSGNNISFTVQSVRDAYSQLFGQAVSEYNAKQKQPCRRIQNYYDHICQGNREEPYYEIVVQFGDMKNAPCGSERGKIVTELLNEYMQSFQQRNPNLHVFNAVLHLDEASPHLHIDFIPFYTKGRVNGLSKGVSMKAALDEMGFQAKGQRINRLVLWEEQERNEMEHILQQHGYAREDKNANYAHMSVEDFKASRDKERMRQKLRESQHVTEDDLSAENVRSLRSALTAAEQRVSELEEERQSPYKAFFYSSPEKQAWVMKKLDELNIPYCETENGFEAQACYVDMIRKLEKEYKTPRTLLRDQLREDIDRGVLQSATIYDLQNYLEQLGYIVKFGKYLSVMPQGSNAFIRVKSLGEHYSDFALRNRIKANAQYAKDLAKEIEDAVNRNATTYPVLRVVQLYMVAFTNRALPVRKLNAMKPVAWTNDAELDRLLALNKRIADGASLEKLRMEFAEKEKKAAQKADALSLQRSLLKDFYVLRDKLEVMYDGKQSDLFTEEQFAEVRKEFPKICESNWRKVYDLIADQEKKLQDADAEEKQAQDDLRESAEMVSALERIMNGTYVQSLVAAENDRRNSEIIPNGIRPGGGAIT